MLLQYWALQMGCCCSCHHLPARPGNHDWLGQFLTTNSFSIFLSFRFWRNKSKTKVKADASFSVDFSLFLRILPSFSRRKQMCSKNNLHFFRVFATKCRDLIRVRHMKSYGGLLQSSFMFSLQLVVLFTRPSVGTLYGIPDGRCRQPIFFRYWAFFSSSVWILVIGLISSLLNLLWDVTIYHIVSGFEMIYHNKNLFHG